MRLAIAPLVAIRAVGELYVYQLSVQFKQAVYRLIRRHSAADGDRRYRDQLFDSALSVSANIAEGFGRGTPASFNVFLSYARGSIGESIARLEDGIDRGHFTAEASGEAITLARRTGAAIAGLQRHLRPQLNSGPNRK
jgi:four helix bundle protein